MDRDASVQVFWKADTKVELQELWGGKGRETQLPNSENGLKVKR